MKSSTGLQLEAGSKINPSRSTPPPPHFDIPTFLMCAPQWYDVDYVINPWMAGNLHRPSRDLAFAQWRELHRRLQLFADVRLIPAVAGSPDMTFVGHAAVVQHGIAALSSFAHPQRRAEEKPLRRWLQDHGFLLWETSRETAFEGEGDALFDIGGRHLWAAHGVRTCLQCHRHIADAWHVPVTSLRLVDPRFYHLDTCFAPLTRGYVMYFPDAFDAPSREAIEANYAPEKRLMVSETEATAFACNLINVGDSILMQKSLTDLPARLSRLGFDVVQLDLSEFIKAGGSAKSLVLRLSDIQLCAEPEA
jgi:N-dimethylarginine dimethylaminohydrolase